MQLQNTAQVKRIANDRHLGYSCATDADHAWMKILLYFYSTAAIFLLSSCNFSAATASPTFTQPPPETIAETASATPQPSSTPTQEPTSTPFPIPHLQAGDEITLRFVHMFDASSGWAIGASVAGQDHILTTSNGGLHWVDISPPERVDLSLGEQKAASAFFLNSQQGWVRYLDSTTIWRTIDQGNEWQPSLALEREIHLPYPVVAVPLQFVDEMNGWLMIYEESGMSHDYVTLYSSNDGGVLWEEILNPSDNSGLQSCCKTGMVFIDTRMALTTFGQGPYERPFVEWTMDGGRTWIAKQLSLPDDPPTELPSAYCDVHSPHFFTEVTAIIGLECKSGEEGEIITHYLFLTNDLGETWAMNEYPGERLLFLDPETGWAIGEYLYSTLDGGATWDLLGTLDWNGQYSFINAQSGWAVKLEDDANNLLQTQDGGRTWTTLEFEIISSD
jgi:photosystem II stability/assembly factor-like uncharacterized protein